ncbi:hypothetical protein MCAP1_001273 [Malassezia caprae]|uniref:MINDY deubiquitinase domain-containing protein n=1 Tax=Malassezia caprae TaxID=1381934 RepID=A0AAF0IW10_9BASI|nr:hypothetical protein MCAP1_001273 [Malassezia caprae]
MSGSQPTQSNPFFVATDAVPEATAQSSVAQDLAGLEMPSAPAQPPMGTKNPFLSQPSSDAMPAEATSTLMPALGAPVASTNAGVENPLSYLAADVSPAAAHQQETLVDSHPVPMHAETSAKQGAYGAYGQEVASDAYANQSGSGNAYASEGATTAPAAAPSAVTNSTQWSLKDVFWHGRETKIIMENELGPCSLISLCNCLLLERRLKIVPADRPAVTYGYLSNLLAEYLLEASTATDPMNELGHVLNALPSLLHNFEVDVYFDAPNKFGADPLTHRSAELSLFSIADVSLLHGWLADPSDSETFEALRVIGSYGRAMTSSLVNVSEPVRAFIQSTPSQVTPYGIEAMKSVLAPGQVGVFLRNAHLYVIYHRRAEEGMSGGPQLFTLVTDRAYLMEDAIVWESLDHAQGMPQSFYDANLVPVSGELSTGAGTTEEDDYALAMRLQGQERDRALAYRSAFKERSDARRKYKEEHKSRVKKFMAKVHKKDSDKMCTIM